MIHRRHIAALGIMFGRTGAVAECPDRARAGWRPGSNHHRKSRAQPRADSLPDHAGHRKSASRRPRAGGIRTHRARDHAQSRERRDHHRPNGTHRAFRDRKHQAEDGGKWSSRFRRSSIGRNWSSRSHALDLATHPNDRYKEDLAKFERRRHDHAELVDAATKAFRVTWAGRETRTEPPPARAAHTDEIPAGSEPGLQAHQPVRGQLSACPCHAMGGRKAGAIRAPGRRTSPRTSRLSEEWPERCITAATS